MAFVRHYCHKGGGHRPDTLPILHLLLSLPLCVSELKWILNQCLQGEMSWGGLSRRLLTISHIFIHRFTFLGKLPRLAALHPGFPKAPPLNTLFTPATQHEWHVKDLTNFFRQGLCWRSRSHIAGNTVAPMEEEKQHLWVQERAART